MLSFLGADAADPDAPDWAAAAVYSCAASCDPPASAESAYVEEWVWVQPPDGVVVRGEG